MKIAVTGAEGFIGRHLIAELSKHHVEIISVVRKLPSPNLAESAKVKVIELDISSFSENVYKQIGSPDVLIHLAWGGLPNYSSLHHFELELPKQYLFLKSLIEFGLKSLVITGTCFEYGMQSGALNENMSASPVNPYGFAKDILRRQLEYLQKTNPFSLTWARLFYLYGEGQSDSSLFSQLRCSVKRSDKEFNMSGGEQLRDYLPVKEVVKSLVTLAMIKKDIGIINISSGKPISVRNLVECWIRDNNWDIELNLGQYPYPNYEPMAFWGDRGKLDYILEKK